MRWTNKRILITLVGMVVVFTALMATRYEFSRSNEYLPAVFLKPNGEPFSLPIKDKPVVVMSGWERQSVLIKPTMIIFSGEPQVVYG